MTMAPMDSEAAMTRHPERHSERVAERPYTPSQPHDKFEIGAEEMPDGMDAFWAPITVAGMSNASQIAEYNHAGWEPAEAKDFARLSGYGRTLPARLLAKGIVTQVDAGDPIVRDGLMLMLRPRELSERAHQERQRAAKATVDVQMKRLNQAYRSARGIGVQRRIAPMPDSNSPEE